MRSITLVIQLFLLLSTYGGLAAAQPPQTDPGRVGDMSVYLLTMGQGDLVWEKFGHNAIWISDPATGTDRVYNYGVFDFDSPGYWGRFLKGNWIYELAVHGIDQTIAQYQYFDRTVVAQELHLTSAEKAELQALLEWNARPENREYLYDYYRDNCSTRLRDVLDQVLGGAIQSQTAALPTGTTYRSHSRRLIADDRLAYAGLSAGLGPPADRPITQWEEMFLPEKLMERAREITVLRGGSPQPLVLREIVLYQAGGREPAPEEPPFWLPWFLVAGSAIGAILAGLGEATRRGSHAARFGFAALGSLWSLLMGTGGLILAALWALTNHTIAHANENLLHIDPLAIGLVLLLPAAAYGARWAERPAWWLAAAVAGISALGFVLQVLPGLDQANGEIIALVLPAHAGVAWGLHRIVRR